MGEQQNTSRGFLGRRQAVEDKVPKRTYNRDSPNYAEYLPPSSRIDLYPVHGARNPRVVGVNFGRPYLDRDQQQDSMFRDPVPPLRKDANHMVLDLPGSGSALERNSESGSEPHIPALSKHIPPPKLDSEIHSQMLRVEDQADHVPTTERDSHHIEQPSPRSVTVLQKVVAKQNICDLKNLLNLVPFEGTPSFNDTEGQYSTKVSHISLAQSTVRTKGPDKVNQDPVQTAPRPTQTLETSSLEMMQRDSTLQTDCKGSSQELERSDFTTTPPPNEHWTTKTPVEYLPLSSSATDGFFRKRTRYNASRSGCEPCKQRRKKCDEMKPICARCSRLHDTCVYRSLPKAAPPASSSPPVQIADGLLEHLPRTLYNTKFPPFITESESRDGPPPAPRSNGQIPELIQPGLENGVLLTGSEPHNRLPALSKLLSLPEQNFPTSCEGSSPEVHSQEEQAHRSPTMQTTWDHAKHPLPSEIQCLALTDEQCRKSQNFVDPDGKRMFSDWQFDSQPQLIRLYMTGISFPQIQEKMRDWS
ncbi:hypothetical protein F5882DRAFT_472091 [Hyaloscypha sp. PMI_1271]|nr:hypothetical protein F5882DRAFT_472091 [Hyaloscypha sp. PMI_1271]